MVAIVSHPMISKYKQQSLIINRLHKTPDDSIHLCELFSHSRVTGVKAMPHMVDSKHVTYDKSPVVLLHLREDVGDHSFVHSVKIFHIEAIERVSLCELIGVQVHPSVIPHEDCLLSLVLDLRDQVVLLHCITMEVVPEVYEGRERPRCHTLDPLHGSSGRVSNEFKQSGVFRLCLKCLIEDFELVPEVFWVCGIGLVLGEVEPHSVD
mmetsp:Transcript_7575/g.14167  ORF Transcript_7575/g.14167 Transcript_7575/m.14167 type:complete len:208 (-) Transcript_7575:161-784(-)